ncbi:MAG: hypothetical protein IJO55_00340 [Lachnospiraceae bacterium]|nr:hypothetical protein [Lachnospiraceae bacterium]
MERTREEITPYRMNHLMKVASRVMDLMINGTFHLTYEEIEIVINTVRNMLEEIMGKNEKMKIEE